MRPYEGRTVQVMKPGVYQTPLSVKHNLVNIRYKGEKPAYGQHTTETLIRLYRQNYHITLNKLEQHWTKIITIYVLSHAIH